MKVLLINVVCGGGSTGRICLELANEFKTNGDEVKIAYGRGGVPDTSKKYAIHIGNSIDQKFHFLKTRLWDEHGLGSVNETKKFIKWADNYDPDLVWIHNIHGYYINYELLFQWIKSKPDMQVRWTLHDCWAFTGHCAYFTKVACEKWMKECNRCTQKRSYPSSIFIDRSRTNYYRKKAAFTGVNNLTIITPSRWLANLVKESFLGEYEIRVMYNKINKQIFRNVESSIKNDYNMVDKKMILGVANIWDSRKGFDDFLKLSYLLDKKSFIMLVGLSDKQIRKLPSNVIGIKKTRDVQELVRIYSAADVFFNPTYEDNYPTVNLEAEACGTKVVTYNTGGAPETIHRFDSKVIPVGHFEEVLKYID